MRRLTMISLICCGFLTSAVLTEGRSQSYSHRSPSSHTRSYSSRDLRSSASSHYQSNSYSRPHSYSPHTSSRSSYHSYSGGKSYKYSSSGSGRIHSHEYSTATHSGEYSGTQRDANGKIKRREAAKDEFKRQRPCPSTGRRSGSCPGYVIDHTKPLECGGADAPSNMQWQTVAEGKAKDKTEHNCR